MTDIEIATLVGAFVGLIGALQAWLVGRTIQHGQALNGDMDSRIKSGATSAIAAYHDTRALPPPAMSEADKLARVKALRDELAGLSS